MKEKIRNYIVYQFRNIEKTKEVEEAMEEAYLNLVELFDSFVQKNFSEEQAYIKSVEQLGDFSSHFSENKQMEKQTIRPEWSESSLVGGLVASAFSVPVMFISLIWGAVFLFLGMLSFFVPAYFYYKNAKYVLETKKDVDYHNQTLKKIFTFYHYHSYAWIVAVSLLISNAIASVVSSGLLFLVLATSEQSITFTEIDQFLMNIMIGALLFLVIFVIVFFIAKHINKKIIASYEAQTGDISSKEIIKNKMKDANMNFSAVLKFILIFLLIILFFVPSIETSYAYFSLAELALVLRGVLYFSFPLFLLFLLLFTSIVFTVIELKCKKNWVKLTRFLSLFLFTVLFLFVYPLAESANPHLLFLNTSRAFFWILFSGTASLLIDIIRFFNTRRPTK